MSTYQPRRLRDSTAKAGTVARRLARQLQLLSAHDRIPRLGSSAHGKNSGRFLLMAARVTVMVVVLLVVVGAASASAVLLIRRIHSSPPTASEPPRMRSAEPARERRHRLPLAREHEGPPADSSHPLASLPAASSVPAAPANVPPRLAERPLDRRTAEARPKAALTAPHAAMAEAAGLSSARPETAPPSAPVLTPPPRAFAETAPAPPTPPPLIPSHAGNGPALVPSTAPPPGGVAGEAALLRQALLALRHDKDARRALELLDVYAGRFPRGSLAPEASAARAQVLLRLGDKQAALRLLDGLPLDQGRQAIELRLARGELRSLAGRCQEALPDFEEVLGRGARAQDEDRARALYGRASCRTRLGDAAGAEEDRQRYLQDFPSGAAARSLRAQP